MRSTSLIDIVSAADATDEEDIILRASLVVALSELYSDKEDFAADPDAQGSAIETRDGATADGTPSARRRAARSRLRHGWAVAASLAAVVVLGGGIISAGRASPAHGGLVDEVADYHAVHSRETAQLVEVPASQAAQLTAWLGENLDREIRVPDLAEAGLHFVGGSLRLVNDRPVAELMYTRAEGLPIAICVSRSDGKPWSIAVERHGAQRTASWANDGYAYVVVGELDDATAMDIAWRVKLPI